MSLWRADGLPEHPRRGDVLTAIREHDNGWREADAAPRVDPETGRPLSFDQLEREDRIEIWRRGARRLGPTSPYAALLILRHAIEIHRDQLDLPGWEGFSLELDELAADLRESAGIEASSVETDYKFLELADLLSLGACGAFGGSFSRQAAGYSVEVELGRVYLAPFPLAGATTVHVAYRRLARTSYPSSAELAGELAEASWRRLPVRAAPLVR